MTEYVVITDTSCLILLDKINALNLLPLIYRHIITTPEIALEFKKELPQWLQVVPVNDTDLIATYNQQVDIGEASAIALAQQVKNSLLIVDDLKGRRLAKQLNIKFTGTMGVLVTARRQNKIPSLKPYFELIKSTDFRIDPKLLEQILTDFNEL